MMLRYHVKSIDVPCVDKNVLARFKMSADIFWYGLDECVGSDKVYSLLYALMRRTRIRQSNILSISNLVRNIYHGIFMRSLASRPRLGMNYLVVRISAAICGFPAATAA